MDSIESSGRVGASGLRSLPPSLRVVSSLSWLERRGSVRFLGREPPWSGEKGSTPKECGTHGAFFFLLDEPETFFSKLLILLTILSMDFCIFSWLPLPFVELLEKSNPLVGSHNRGVHPWSLILLK
ncbi:unnamed protein product [Microthlaspi erraticum]|uniref:Uncharacterized protein n=1 Tax=Microthlaspi erraticum TaxID=1685480 RepID=A0A6D2KU64_9BRAS|nr:unnamed protein product [Microthlaspi erraticum]